MNSTIISDLERLDRQQLVSKWKSAFRGPPPKSVGKRLLVAALAHHTQAAETSGLSPSSKRQLFRLLEQPGAAQAKRSALQTGTRLVRDWNGRKHVVDVIEGGFVWNSRVFTSLSAVAREITGARWSGPRFFGL